jgi:hypothetical protein
MRDLPKLSWLNGKTFVQSNGGRKNAPGRKEEHTNALIEHVQKNTFSSPEEIKAD